MTEAAGAPPTKAPVRAAVGRRPWERKPSPVVPEQDVAGRAMVLVIAIMTFLSCLTLGAVTLINDTARTWQSQIAREATIQIRPTEGLDIEAALSRARDIANRHAGVRAATIVDREATMRLLEPWLGSGVDIDSLPVPRLVIVTIDPDAPPDFEAMRSELADAVPQASLDDHRTWVDRLIAMARSTVTIGVFVLGLMLGATVLSVIFATRGAMSGNGHVIEVLHLVGAEPGFIAAEFRRHFLRSGMQGAAAGGACAALLFIAFSWWSARNLATPEADQASALFGNFAIGPSGYAGVGLVVVLVACLTAVTTHITVTARLREIDARQHDW